MNRLFDHHYTEKTRGSILLHVAMSRSVTWGRWQKGRGRSKLVCYDLLNGLGLPKLSKKVLRNSGMAPYRVCNRPGPSQRGSFVEWSREGINNF